MLWSDLEANLVHWILRTLDVGECADIEFILINYKTAQALEFSGGVFAASFLEFQPKW
jgi:hypothetical protein